MTIINCNTKKQSFVFLKLNKAASIGMCILELSKVLMYESHYDCIKNKYDNKSKILFTSTDNLMYKIKTENVYEDFSSNKEMFDFSNYSTKSKYYDDSNKLVIGKMKDETGGVAVEEFFELKPKIYSLLVDDNSEHKNSYLNDVLIFSLIRTAFFSSIFSLVITAFLSACKNSWLGTTSKH